MKISEFQKLMEVLYGQRDKKRGLEQNFLWFLEEIGELARALNRREEKQKLEEEFADVFAWLCSLASLSGVDMEQAIQKYKQGCPKCQKTPCGC